MVGFFTGLGSGAERGSANVIGSAGLLGSGTAGRSGQQVMLNAVTGNLMIQQRDEMLVGRGPDAAIGRTYNSLGNLSDENSDNWRQSTDRRVYGPVGTKNVADSTIKRVSADGSEITYTYQTLSRTVGSSTYYETAYFATDGAGAYDKLVWNGSNSWTWTDGDSQATEIFAQSLGSDIYLISSAKDVSLNTLAFAYVSGSPSHLDTVTTADGGYVKYTWSGNNITSIETHYTDLATSTAKTMTRTSYAYTSGRLTSVTVDLTPENSSDSVTYVTTYGYDSSGRVTSIAEGDGSSLTVHYDSSGRVDMLTQLVAGSTTRVTSIAYDFDSSTSTYYTTITDPLLRVTRLDYDAADNLTKITMPPAYSGATQQVSRFTYNTRGDITSTIDAIGNTTSFTYDSYGNSLTATDSLGERASRIYGLKNELLLETRKGSDAASADASHTTRYTYDDNNRLRHIINADGRVQLFGYDPLGNFTKTWYYAGSTYDVSALASDALVSYNDVIVWSAGAPHLDEVARSTMTYDLRGNLLQQIDFAAAASNGGPVPTGGTRVTDFIYDQAGQLLKRVVAGVNPETFVYDGLGRVTASTDANGATVSIAFYDSSTTTVVTLTTGLVQTSTYNKAGDLLDFAESGSNTEVGTAHGAYDQLGRLRKWTDTTGRINYIIYDGAGRKVGDVDQDGHLVEYRYDADNRIVATIRHQNTMSTTALADAMTPYDLSATGNRPAAHADDLWTWTIYDAQGRLVETIDGAGGVATYQYDKSDRLVATISSFNKLTSSQMSTIRATLPTAPVAPAAGADAVRDRIERNFYDKSGHLIGTLDGEGYLTQTVYDGANRVIQITAFATATNASVRASGTFNALLASAGTSSTDRNARYVYDGEGLLRYSVDAQNHVTAYGYQTGSTTSEFGPVRVTTRYANTIAALSYYSVATVQAAITTNADDRASYSVYDLAGRRAFSIDAVGGVIGYEYDGAGQLVRTTQFAATRTTTTLPTLDEMGTWRTTNANATNDRVTRAYYNARGEIRYTIDAEGFISRFDFDAEGRANGTTRWDTAVSTSSLAIDTVKILPTGTYTATAITYDNEGRVATTTDGEGVVTTYAYNANGTLLSAYQAYGAADVVQTSFVYDGAGRVMSRYDAYGTADQTLTQFAYNAFGEISSTIDPNGATATSTYNLLGQLLTVTDPLGGVTSFSYDSFGAIAQTTDANTKSSYVYYDTLGRVVATRDADNRVTQTSYNAFSEVETVTRRFTLASGSTAVAPSVAADAARDQVMSFTYDKVGRLLTSNDAETVPTVFTYNAFGEVATETDPLDTSRTIQTTNSYDRRGLLKIQVVDSASGGKAITTSFGYDAFGRVLTLTDANTKVTTNTYDKQGRLLTSKDALNNTTTYSYDKRGNLVSVKDSADKITRYVYDRQDRQIAMIDALGAVTVNSYDANGNLVVARTYTGTISVTGLALQVTASAYSALSAAASDHVVRYAYDTDNRLRFTVDALMRVTENVYDAAGNVLHSTAYGGTISVGSYTVTTVAAAVVSLASATETRTTRMVYDAANQLSYTIDAANQVTRYFYDSFGNLTKRIEFAALYTSAGDQSPTTMDTWATTSANLVDARTTRAYYDRDNRLRYSVDALGFVTRQDYNKAGGVITQTVYAAQYSATDSTTLANLDTNYTGTFTTARITQFSYDSAGRLETTTDPEGFVTKLVLDQMGRVLSSTAAFGLAAASITAFTYDDVGRVLTRTDGSTAAEATVTAFGYDTLGRVIQQTTANGTANAEISKWEYDALGQVTKATSAFGTADAISSYSYYDAFGNVVKTIDPRGNASFAFYDELGRVKRQVDAQHYVTDTTYTRGNQIASVKRWANALTGTVTATTYPSDPTPDTAHDATTSFSYDKTDQLKSTTDAEGYSESYTLNAFGERVSVTNRLGGTSTYTFDKNGRLLTETLPVMTKNSSGTAIAIINSYSYDTRGNRTQMVEAVGAVEVRTTNYAYDKLDRLIDVTHDAVTVVNDDLTSTTGVVPAEHYVYDARGNVVRTTDAAGAQSFAYYDALNRKVAEVSPVGTLTHYEYDANGNLKSSIVFGDAIALPTTPGGTRPGPINAANSRKMTYAYDALNRLKTSTMVAQTTGDLRTGEWNGANYVLTTSGNIETKLEYDANGNVTRQTDGRGNSIYSWYDLLGRKTAQVDAENYLTLWTFDAEGNALSETRFATFLSSFTPGATPPTAPSASANDRATTFDYDRNGRRTSETRSSVQSYTVSSGGGLGTVSYASAVIHYTYNGLGEVATKTEANGDATAYTYDTTGRLTFESGQSFTNQLGVTVTPRTAYTYDGLNNLQSTRVQLNATANDTDDRITTYTYGAGGRLASATDASGFTHNYGYDVAGRQVRDSYVRKDSAGSNLPEEAIVTRYDIAGRVVTQTNARLSGATWVFTDASSVAYDAVRLRYNAYGEMTGRGVTAGPGSTAIYQEVFDYDPGGRLWHSNSGDGVDRFYLYDKTGNQTLTLASTGADLSALTFATYTASLTGDGDTSTANAVTSISVFDKRGQAKEMRSPDRLLAAGGSTVTITTAKTYNAFGEVTSETDARGYTTTFSYNTMGKLQQKVSPQVSVTAENGAQSNINPTENYFYDISGRMVAVENANSVQAGIASPSDPNARFYTTRLLLAGSGHGEAEALVSKEFHPDSGVVETKYDVFGDARALINEVGSTTLTDYDKLARAITVTHPQRAANSPGNGSTATQLVDHYVYDGLGQRIGHWNSQFTSAWLEKTDYDIKGRVTATIGFAGDTMTYGYSAFSSASATNTNGLGNFGGWTRTTTNAAAGVSSWEITDYFGRTVDSQDFGGHNYDFSFNKAGQLTARGNAGGESLTFSYFNTGLAAGQAGTQGTAGYSYDAAGNRVAETFAKSGTTYRDAVTTYDALGRMSAWEDHAASVGWSSTTPIGSTWDYDANGNVRRTHANYVQFTANGAFDVSGAQDHWYTYDAMNRVVVSQGSFSGTAGSGSIVRGSGIQTSYRADGSRATTLRTSDGLAWSGYRVHDKTYPSYEWYSDEAWDPGTPVQYISLAATSTFTGNLLETYTYSADGQLAETYASSEVGTATGAGPEIVGTGSMGTARLTAQTVRDELGRITGYKEYGAGTTSYERSSIVYDRANRQLSETNVTVRRDTTGTVTATYLTNSTNSWTGGLLTGQALVNFKNGTDEGVNGAADTSQSYHYNWWDGALQSSIDFDGDTHSSANAVWTTTYGFDASGHVTQAGIVDGQPRTVHYTGDQNGMIVDRTETKDSGNTTTGSPRSLHYIFAGRQLGQAGNNGTDNVSYVAAIATRLKAPLNPADTGPFTGGAKTATPFADFDQNYDAINGSSQSSTASSYTVQSGESLQAIAAQVWGDANLWYLIADANGLSGSSSLAPGQTLIVPNKVVTRQNTSDTFRPYDPNEALGDTSPTLAPKPPKAKANCGVLGAILLVAIAVAVTIVAAGATAWALAPATAHIGSIGAGIGALASGSLGLGVTVAAGVVGGLAGSIVSQGVGVATGLQQRFDWKGVALSAISGAVSGGVAKLGLFADLGKVLSAGLNGALSSTITQGIGVATGLQKKFDFAGVAAAGIGAGVGAWAGNQLGATALTDRSLSNISANLVAGVAGGIANAATRSVLAGTDFGDTLMAALPDVIGQTVGQLIGNTVVGKPAPATGGGTPIRIGDPDSPTARILRGEVLPGQVKIDGGPGAASGPSTGSLTVPSLSTPDSLKSVLNFNRYWVQPDDGQTTAPLVVPLGDNVMATVTIAPDLKNQTFREGEGEDIVIEG